MDSLFRDVTAGLRSLLRTPLPTVLAVLSLGLGIGAATTVFTAVDAIVLRPLDAPDPDDLVAVYTTNEERGWTRSTLSFPDVVDYGSGSRTLDLAAYADRDVNLSVDGGAEHVPALTATSDIFRVLGVGPSLGRGFLEGEDRVGAPRVAVLGHSLWNRRFGGDPSVVGSTVQIDGVPHEVVGVLPERTPLPFSLAEVWTPAEITGEESRVGRAWWVVGRLRDGASLEQARTEMELLAGRLERAHPADDAGMGVAVLRFRDDLYGDDPRTGTLTLLAGSLLVLLIACFNVVNLLLARAIRREQELAVRAALGASRIRLVRHLVVESALLGIAGGALGTVLSIAGVRSLLAILPAIFARIITMNATVLVFAIVVAIASGILIGITPALQATRAQVGLSGGGVRGSSSGRRQGRLRRGLVVAEMAMALVLLTSSGLLVKSLNAYRDVDLGFNAGNLMTFSTRVPSATYPTGESVRGFFQRLVERIDALPGVLSASATHIAPLNNENHGTYYTPEGEQYPAGQEPVVPYRNILPGYFETMEMPLLEGRAITSADAPGSPPVLVVSESFAARHWPDGPVLGRRVRIDGEDREVVGVVGDIRLFGPASAIRPTVYMPAAQKVERTMDIVVRTAGDPGAFASTIRATVAELDPDQALFDVETMEERLRFVLVGEIAMPRIGGALGLLALLLALAGVYGVMAHSVALRMRETGIRMALGAGHGRILRMVVGQGSRVALVGVLIGLALAVAAARGLASQLFGVSTFDPMVFIGVPLALFAAGILASWIPARRATRADPVACLRAE